MNAHRLRAKLTRHVLNHLLASRFIHILLSLARIPLVLVSKLAHLALVHPLNAIWEVSNLVFYLPEVHKVLILPTLVKEALRINLWIRNKLERWVAGVFLWLMHRFS